MKIACIILSALCIVSISESGERGTTSDKLSWPHADLTHLERKIHNMVNKEREKKGLPALSWDESLHSIARKHSRDMVKRAYFSHDDPDGRNFCDRYKAARFECRIRVNDTICLGAENISQVHPGNSTFYKDGKTLLNGSMEDKIAESVVREWMGSKNHRANILTPYFRRQGIGVALSDDGKFYVTENFC